MVKEHILENKKVWRKRLMLTLGIVPVAILIIVGLLVWLYLSGYLSGSDKSDVRISQDTEEEQGNIITVGSGNEKAEQPKTDITSINCKGIANKMTSDCYWVVDFTREQRDACNKAVLYKDTQGSYHTFQSVVEQHQTANEYEAEKRKSALRYMDIDKDTYTCGIDKVTRLVYGNGKWSRI